jgi:hypothetical protein
MRALIRFLVLLAVAAAPLLPASGQTVHTPQDSLRNRALQDSLSRRQTSPKSPIMKVDSTMVKQGDASAQQSEVKKPRSSTVRTLERQTATHAAKNAPRVKTPRATTR